MATYGYTPHCKGCSPMRLARAILGHGDSCRARIVVQLKRRPGSRMRVERADVIRTAKLARYIEWQDVASSRETATASGRTAG